MLVTLMRSLLYSGLRTRYIVINLEEYSDYANHLGQNNVEDQNYQQSRHTTMINNMNGTIVTMMKHIESFRLLINIAKISQA